MQNNNKIIKKTGIIALLFLFFSIYMVYYTNPALLVKQENQVSNNLNQNASYGKVFNEYVEPGPPPKRASQNIPQNQKVYIAIIDSEYRPSNHHCLMRQAWIDDAEKLEFVDGVEIVFIMILMFLFQIPNAKLILFLFHHHHQNFICSTILLA